MEKIGPDITWDAANYLAGRLAERHRQAFAEGRIKFIVPIPRGGLVVAGLVADYFREMIPKREIIIDWAGASTSPHCLVVDDIADSGATMADHVARLKPAAYDALVQSPRLAAEPRLKMAAPIVDGWITFPWEKGSESAGPGDAIRRLLQFIGEDPDREGLKKTPERVLKSFKEMTEGYAQDPREILATTFAERCDEMIVVTGIEFTSMCEHHMLPFIGTACVGYIPRAKGGRIVGLSKIPRLVDCFARRLQVQERMTSQIADAMQDNLDPAGVGVIVSASHQCLACRGAKKPAARMITSSLLGAMRETGVRSEFLRLAGY